MKLAASLLLYLLIPLISHRATAQTMSNDSYKLKTTIYNSSQSIYNNTDSKSAQDSEKFADNILVGTNPFIFSVSQTLIDYGLISPTNPVSRTNTLTVSSNFINGYTVSAFENHKLINETSKAAIPNTTCDTGTCNGSNAGPWDNILTYGFGYRCDNQSGINSCANDFYNTNYYKHFPDISNSENPQIVMTSTSLGESKTTITYKLNTSGVQPLGFYNNVITFLAIPNF